MPGGELVCGKQALEMAVLFGGRGTWGQEGLLGVESFSSVVTLFLGTRGNGLSGGRGLGGDRCSGSLQALALPFCASLQHEVCKQRRLSLLLLSARFHHQELGSR